MKLDLDDKLVQDVVKDQLKQAMVLQMEGSCDEIIKTVVESMLATRVDDDGKVTKRDSYRSHDLIEFYSKKMVSKMAKEAIEEFFEKKAKQLKKKRKEVIEG